MQNAPPAPRRWGEWLRRFAPPVIGLLLFAAAIAMLANALKGYKYADVVKHVHNLPRYRLFVALGFTFLAYFVLTGYDSLAFRYIKHPLPYGKIAFAAFLGYAFSHNFGNAIIAGGSVRYRLYSAWGLSTVEIAKVVTFGVVTFGLGYTAIGGVVLLADPGLARGIVALSPTVIRGIGALCLLAVALYLGWCAFHKGPIRVRGWVFPSPPASLSFAQIAITGFDLVLAGAVLYSLLPPSELSFPAFVGMYLFAIVLGLASHVPGGLGVFETAFLALTSSVLPKDVVIGALLVFRGMYFLLPLAVAVICLGIHEVILRADRVRRFAQMFGDRVPSLIPNIFAAYTFVSGALLVISGATPAIGTRVQRVEPIVGLAVIEGAHLLAGMIGAAMLALAHGLQRRLGTAYRLTVALLVAGILATLLKGFDYEEAVILFILFIGLVPCRGYFYRQAGVLNEPFTIGWTLAIPVALAFVVWLGFFTHKHTAFTWDLWTVYAVEANASRSLRATAGALIVSLLFALARLRRPPAPEPAPPHETELALAARIVRTANATYAHRALHGDRTLLFNDSETAFLMYAIAGRSWVAFGDPIGNDAERRELVWRFRQIVDHHAGWPVFHDVAEEDLPLYLDLGLTRLRLGDDALVPLAPFFAGGPIDSRLREIYDHSARVGLKFDVVPLAQVQTFLQLAQPSTAGVVSDSASRAPTAGEVSDFNATPIWNGLYAVLRQNVNTVAAAPIYESAGKVELAIDQPTYNPSGGVDLVDSLLIHAMAWGRDQGYRTFNLGLTPPPGAMDPELAAFWKKLAGAEDEGDALDAVCRARRAAHERFAPQWRPKYLASPGGLALPRILRGVARLVTGSGRR